MVPTDDAIITRQMLYSGVRLPATAAIAFAINSSVNYGISTRNATVASIANSGLTRHEHPPQPRVKPQPLQVAVPGRALPNCFTEAATHNGRRYSCFCKIPFTVSS